MKWLHILPLYINLFLNCLNIQVWDKMICAVSAMAIQVNQYCSLAMVKYLQHLENYRHFFAPCAQIINYKLMAIRTNANHFGGSVWPAEQKMVRKAIHLYMGSKTFCWFSHAILLWTFIMHVIHKIIFDIISMTKRLLQLFILTTFLEPFFTNSD